jgi:poly(3-hydroxybutyrate) depolymerase
VAGGYSFSLFSAPGFAPKNLVVMLSGYCLPADGEYKRVRLLLTPCAEQETMQLNYLTKMSQYGFAYAPLKSSKTASVCDLCPATVSAARAAQGMPLYAASALLLEPLTRAGLCTAWDATAACCQPQLGGKGGGDVALINAVIAAAKAAVPSVQKIYLVGIANGGFMALRVACEIGEQLSGVLAYASGLYPHQCARPEAAPSMVLMQGGTAAFLSAQLEDCS